MRTDLLEAQACVDWPMSQLGGLNIDYSSGIRDSATTKSQARLLALGLIRLARRSQTCIASVQRVVPLAGLK
jgi:hypothetical protein